MITIDEYAFPDDLHYDKDEHFWVRLDGDEARVGLDALALDALGQIVHVDIRKPGVAVEAGEQIGTLEAEKMVSPLTAPVGGELSARNESVLRSPLLIREDPYGQGWLVAIRPAAPPDDGGRMVSGADIAAWAEAEVGRYRENGWIG